MAETCNYPNLERLIEILEILRSENGCAWDREQTHYSLKKNMIEEAYEAVDAIEDGDCKHLKSLEMFFYRLFCILKLQKKKTNSL